MNAAEQKDFNVGRAMIDVESFVKSILLTPEGMARDRVCLGAALALAGVMEAIIGQENAKRCMQTAVSVGLTDS